MPDRPPYEIGATWSSLNDTDVQLNVCVGDKHFRIDLFTSNFSANPQLLKEYLLHVERSDPTFIPPPLEDPDEYVDPLEEFYDWATAPFAPLFCQIPPLDRSRAYTLQDCLFAEQFIYTLQVAGDKLVPVQRHVDTESWLVGVLLPASRPLDRTALPVYRPGDVYVLLDNHAVALPMNPRKVFINGSDVRFFKQIPPGDVSMTVTELATYSKIRAAGLGDHVRVSRLLGFVEDEHTSRIVGLLLSYIDCQNMTLSCAVRGSDRALLQKWLDQITHSINELHRCGIVWGDAKPDNVLVDVHNNAYLIDFGGGYTNGWVDKELNNTQAGDLQGLSRIEAWLNGMAE
jgi:hypothetical protein